MVVTEFPRWDAISERLFPPAFGIVAGAAVVAVSPNFFSYALLQQWNFSALYDAGFDFAAVATSFLFTFYTFVVTAERGFIARMKGTYAYNLLLVYSVRALVMGVVQAVASLVMMVVVPFPDARWTVATMLCAAWATITAWSIASFIRTAWLFIEFAKADA